MSAVNFDFLIIIANSCKVKANIRMLLIWFDFLFSMFSFSTRSQLMAQMIDLTSPNIDRL